MTDLAATIAPKSDQLNADDLIGRTMTIKITKVTGSQTKEQPIDIHFEGDGGKPYKPCKSMRRVMVHLWGRDGSAYVGRSMTLYRDEKVRFGGVDVGGIRISHMSDIPGEVTMALTASKTSRKPYTVKPLKSAPSSGGKSELAVEDPASALLAEIRDLLRVKCGDGVKADADAVKDFLKGRDPSKMPIAELEAMKADLAAM